MFEDNMVAIEREEDIEMGKIEEKDRGLKLIKEFVVDELSDYGYYDFKDIKFEEEYNENYYYVVTIKTQDNKEKELTFKYVSKGEGIFVELGEDVFEEVRDYDWTVKYFWMALLTWEVSD